MKNPFLQDRNIFSKVQKSSTTLKTSTNQSNPQQIQNKTEQRKSYTATQFNDKPIQKSTNYGPSSAGFTSSYQRQAPKQPSNQYNLGNNNKFTSQKITFGDPTTSQAYHGQRTSGYFNILGSQNNANRQQISYDKYEPKVNNFAGVDKNPFTRNSFAVDKEMRDIKKFDKGYNERMENKSDYEFAPPPINNFSNDYQPNQKKYGYKSTDYDYKANIQGQYHQQQESYPQQQPYSASNQYEEKFTKQNPYLSQQKSQSFKSPPKPNQPPFTPKNDISYQFRQNNYAELSPIGEVSHHKIQEDSLVNLDGLMQNVQLDKLLAQSKTQQELLKILGMDTSIMKKNQYQEQSIKKKTPQDNRTYQYESKNFQQNTYLNQRENQFSKKVYQQETYVQNNNQYQAQYQQTYKFKNNNFKSQDQEPQVLNYAQHYGGKDNQMINKSKSYNNKIQQTETYNIPRQKQTTNDQFFNPSQYQLVAAFQNKPKQNQQQDDLEKIIQKQMEKFILQKQGPSKGKRIFMTASQKIVTKKYNLAPL